MGPSYEDSRQSDAPAPRPPVNEVLDPPVQNPTMQLDITWASIFRVLLTVAVVFLVFLVWRVVILVFFSLMIVAAFNPLVRRLQQRVNRTGAVLAVMLGFILLVVGALSITVPSILEEGKTLVQTSPQHVLKLQRFLNNHHIRINVQRQVETLSAKYSDPFPQAWFVFSGVAQGVAGAIASLVLAIYLLIEGQRTGNTVARLLPRDKRLGARRMIAQVGDQVGGYIRGQLIASCLAGLFSAAVLLAMHVPQALALAALAAIMDVVPFVGILVATLTATFMALNVSAATAAVVFVLYAIYHQVESHILIPQIYGNTLGLSFSVIVISVLVGAEMLGMVGAILALPVAAAIPSIAAFIHEWHEEEPEPPQTDPQPNGHLPP